MADLSLAEVIDLDELQRTLEDFSDATGLATVGVDIRGIPVTNVNSFTDFCRSMRADPVRSQLCYGCDAHGGLQSLIQGTPHVYRCHAGLVDFSLPLTNGSTYLGAILCGQVRVPEREQPDYLTARSAWEGDPQLADLYDGVQQSHLRRVVAAAKTLLGLSLGFLDQRSRPRALDPQPLLSAAAERPRRLPLATVPQPQAAVPELGAPARPSPSLKEALDAEDLATAVVEVSRTLDDVFQDRDGPARRLAELEDEIVAATVACAPRLAPHLTQMVQRHRERRATSVDRYQTQLYLERMLGMVLDEVLRSRPHRRQDLRDLLNTIARHPNRALSLTEAAAATHWSPGHLSKLFKSVTGCTFVSYVTAWRIWRARLLLASTQMPIRRIAVELDFHQVNYFSRVFRSHVGMSPSEYRRLSTTREGRPPGVPLQVDHHAVLRT